VLERKFGTHAHSFFARNNAKEKGNILFSLARLSRDNESTKKNFLLYTVRAKNVWATFQFTPGHTMASCLVASGLQHTSLQIMQTENQFMCMHPIVRS
jgi:hypothetical protein